MNNEIIVALIYNSTLLLSLSIIYEVLYFVPSRLRRFQPYFSGILISIICVIIMALPFTLQSGVVFDTRSILISATAFIFGLIPAVFTVVSATVFRLIVGGIGAFPGIVVIISSAAIGLIWRRWLSTKARKPSWLNIYVMSLCVHIVMLVCMLLLPYPVSINVIKSMALPVIVLYPVASILLCMLLLRQQALKNTQLQVKQSEEKFKLLFTEAPVGYQSLDQNGNVLEVNQQWIDMFGYTRDEVIGKWFGDILPPTMKESFQTRFEQFKKAGRIHSEFEIDPKNGDPLYIAFEGKIAKNADGSFKQTHCILKDITSQKKAETALVESERKYRNIADNISDVVWKTDLNFQLTYISPSVLKLIGETPERMLRKKMTDIFPEHSIRYINSLLLEEQKKEQDAGVKDDPVRTIEIEQYQSDGTLIWVGMNISASRDQNGVKDGYIGVSRNITQRKKAERALKESERSKSVLISNLPGLAYRCQNNRERSILFVSDGCIELTGYTPEMFVDSKEITYNDIIAPEYLDTIDATIDTSVKNRSRYSCEYEIITSTGVRKWVLDMGQGITDHQNQMTILEGIVLDISDRKNNEIKLRYMNEHDRWTGLFNREYLEASFRQDMGKMSGINRAFISVDLSTIQLLTANYGFRYTQNIIKQVAETLSRFCNDNLSLYQMNENRFVYYYIDYKDQKELQAFCDSIAKTMRAIFASDRIGGGIGAVEIQPDDQALSLDDLLKRLSIASERSITILNQDFSVCFYDAKLEDYIIHEAEVRQALSEIATGSAADDLYLNYQPILSLKSNTIVGVEALARIKTPQLGLVSPMDFIPIAEKTKLIIPIGEKIIVQSLHLLQKLENRGYSPMSISINVSVVQLLQPDFTERLINIIKSFQANPRNIIIELTESVFSSDFERINHIIHIIKQAEMSIAVDDFGTGYSSLARVKELDIDYLKIDKYFIEKLAYLHESQAITGDIISMAHKLGHSTVAEGVENDQQMRYLRNNNCDRVQGYLISKPLDEDSLLDFLENYQYPSGSSLTDMNKQ